MMNKVKIVSMLSQNNNIVKVELNEFICVQNKIAMRFIDKLENYKKFDIVDKYFSQTIEEIWEVLTEQDNHVIFEELIDVLMYLGSLYSVINDYEIDYIENIYAPTDVYNDYLNNENIGGYKNRDKMMNKVLKNIISIRRLYPERKWHKNEKSLIDNDENITISNQIILQTIIMVILYIIDNEGCNKLNLGLSKKQNYILSLDNK